MRFNRKSQIVNRKYTISLNHGLATGAVLLLAACTSILLARPFDVVQRGGQALPVLPDLAVESISVQNGALEVVIANRGGRAVTQPFWVDAYLNPDTPPTGVNQTWPMLGERGIAWGVRG